MTTTTAPTPGLSWTFDRSAGLHMFGDRATIQKVGESYCWAVVESPDNYYGESPTLKRAKWGAEARMSAPEPESHICYDCRTRIYCRLEWSGHPYYGWANHFPGTLQIISTTPGGGVMLAYVCAGCLNLRTEANRLRQEVEAGV